MMKSKMQRMWLGKTTPESESESEEVAESEKATDPEDIAEEEATPESGERTGAAAAKNTRRKGGRRNRITRVRNRNRIRD